MLELPLIDYERVREVSRIVARLRGRLEDFADPFTDPRYYPDPHEPDEMVAAYFLTLVAMDHRLSRPGRPYEAEVEGERFHGADLLYRLGRIKLERDPQFFTAERLSRVTTKDVLEWLCVDTVCPPDPERRAALLRDLGFKLLRLYDGRATALLELSKGRLRGPPEAPGLVNLLRVFEAYGDPVEKKSMLLAKFLERRKLISIADGYNKRVPVDNHVTRIALRLGLVVLEERLLKKLLSGAEFEWWEDVAVRVAVREAWHQVALEAGVDAFILDDALWTMGRKICTFGTPHCENCRVSHPFCVNGRCAFVEVCPARRQGLYVNEHCFLNTWWY